MTEKRAAAGQGSNAVVVFQGPRDLARVSARLPALFLGMATSAQNVHQRKPQIQSVTDGLPS